MSLSDATLDRQYSATVDAAGEAVIAIETMSQLAWSVRQVSVELEAAPFGSTCTMRKNGRFISYAFPTGDVISEPPPLTLRPGETVTLTWTGCTPGDVASAWVSYDVLKYGS
jgi:hypothetical protein